MAAEYAIAGDVDPRVGEHLLDVLGLAGIAAYLQPASDLHPVTRTTTLPSTPTDRLYVDRRHLATARAHLEQLRREEAEAAPVGDAPRDEVTRRDDSPRTDDALTGDDARAAVADDGTRPDRIDDSTRVDDIDTAWASIIAAYNATVDPTAANWPAAENLAGTGGGAGTGTGTDERPAGLARWPGRLDVAPERPDRPGGSLLDGLDAFGAALPDDDDEGYTPPPPPPLPRFSPYTVLAVCGIAVGLVVLIWPTLLPVSGDTALVLGFAGIISGFATLVWRLRPGDEDDNDRPDDGAVV